MSKRHINIDCFNGTIKRRRVHEPTIIVKKEPEIVAIDGDSESLNKVQEPCTPTTIRIKKPDADDLLLSSRNTLSSIGRSAVSASTRTMNNNVIKENVASPSAQGRLHGHLLKESLTAFHHDCHHQHTKYEEARFLGSISYASRTSQSPSIIMCGARSRRPASQPLSPARFFGRGFQTTSTRMPPLPSFVEQTESRMDPTVLPVKGQCIHNSRENALSALISSYQSLLLDAHRKSLDDELVLASRVSNWLQERDFFLTPKNSVMASLTRANRRGDPSLLASHQQVYGAGAHGSRQGVSSWLGGTTTADDDMTLGLPQRTLAQPFLPFEEYQVMLLQQALAAKNHDHTGHRRHGFEAVPTSSCVDSILLRRQCSSVNTGGGKTSQPLERRSTTPCIDLQEKALPWQTHASSKTSSACNRGTRSFTHLLSFPVATDKNTRDFSERICIPLATDEDPNWLSEFLCFVRSDIVEVFRASEGDVKSRNTTKKVNHGQVGIRCRFCAHKPFTMRTKRSSSFPFTMSRIYQSLTMMLRDHFGDCSFIPDPIKERYLLLKGKTPQGASGSNQYWELSARKLGLTDSPLGIWVQESSDSQGKSIDGEKHLAKNLQPNKSRIQTMGCESKPPSVLGQQVPMLVQPDDQAFMSDFLYELLTQIQLVHLDESERIGNRKNLKAGMPGLGCRYCCQKNRKGLCRTFPARRRTLPVKLSDLFEHIRRCSLCPKEQRERLMILNRKNEELKKKESKAGDTAFLDCLWERMNAKTKAPTGS